MHMNDIKLFEADLAVCVTGKIDDDGRLPDIDNNLETIYHVETTKRQTTTVWTRELVIKLRWLASEKMDKFEFPDKKFRERAVEEFLNDTGIDYIRYTIGGLSEAQIAASFDQEKLFSIEAD